MAPWEVCNIAASKNPISVICGYPNGGNIEVLICRFTEYWFGVDSNRCANVETSQSAAGWLVLTLQRNVLNMYSRHGSSTKCLLQHYWSICMHLHISCLQYDYWLGRLKTIEWENNGLSNVLSCIKVVFFKLCTNWELTMYNLVT